MTNTDSTETFAEWRKRTAAEMKASADAADAKRRADRKADWDRRQAAHQAEKAARRAAMTDAQRADAERLDRLEGESCAREAARGSFR